MGEQTIRPQFAVCLNNPGYPASLERWKVYRVLDDPQVARVQANPVNDESGEDYVYPADWFAPVTLPRPVIDAYLATS